MGSDVSRKASRILTALVGWLVTTGAATAAPYKITEFLSEGDAYLGLNNRGQVFGAQGIASGSRAFVFDSLGPGRYRIMDQPTSAGIVSGPRDDVFVMPASYGRSAIYDATTGRSASLDFPSPYTHDVRASDDAGRLYGQAWYYSPDGSTPSYNRPFVVEDGVARELDLPLGASAPAMFVGVNAGGDVLIQAGPEAKPQSDAYLLRDGNWTHLGPFGAVAINDKGDVLAYARPENNWPDVSPILIPADGSGPVPLGSFPGAMLTYVNAINNRGEIVGTGVHNGAGEMSPFIYRGGVATDLDTLIDRTGKYGDLDVRYITAINDLGQILVRGTDGGHWVDLLLSPSDLDAAEGVFVAPPPVPEPSTLLVFAGLALGVGLARRRKRA